MNNNETQKIFNKLLNKDVADTVMNHVYKNNYQNLKKELLVMKRYGCCENCNKMISRKETENYFTWLLNSIGPIEYSLFMKYGIKLMSKLCSCSYRCMDCVIKESQLDSVICSKCGKSLRYYEYILFYYMTAQEPPKNNRDECWTVSGREEELSDLETDSEADDEEWSNEDYLPFVIYDK